MDARSIPPLPLALTIRLAANSKCSGLCTGLDYLKRPPQASVLHYVIDISVASNIY